MKQNKSKGTAVFYTRDSGGKHEMTPGQYVAWAVRTATELSVSFDGTPDAIAAMIREGRSVHGDLFLDYDVKGNILSREGLDAMIKRAVNDRDVTHVLIPRRDRLARPDDPLDPMQLENALRSQGLTLVFMDRVLLPLEKGKRQDISELIVALVDYDRSGRDRRDLAEKIVYAQIRLAKLGFSTGGRARYGFARWLVKEDGTRVRPLADGERVRLAGHHVAWLPEPGPKLDTALRIVKMLEAMPASRVAATLTAEGVPSPDAGRWRTDNGVKHPVSGIWSQSTVVNIGRNQLLSAISTYGVRSMGDQLRYSPDGPRELKDADFRLVGKESKPKVIRNSEENRIIADAKFEPLVDPEQHRRVIDILDARAGTQRGKPRSHDPARNPLGGRVFDMNCTWPMYREPSSGSFRYKCGLYQQSHGQKCAHNHVGGPTATRFVLSCVRQLLLSPNRLHKVEQRIRALAAADSGHAQLDQEIRQKRTALAQVEADRAKIEENLARAENDDQYQAIARVFSQTCAQQDRLTAEIAASEAESAAPKDADSEVTMAMEIIRQLTELAAQEGGLASAREIFDLVNARMFLGFRPVRVKKRTFNKVSGGIVTFGEAPPPIEVYQGPTAREKLKGPAASAAAGPGERHLPSPPKRGNGSGREDRSLGNVSRGDWI